MIPILPCRSIDDQIAFYEALGFEVTYRHQSPNVFAAIQRGAIELQFFVLKGYEPANSYSTCYVLVSDIEALYADFRAGLKQALGRTWQRRPDLIEKRTLSPDEAALLEEFRNETGK